VLKLIALADGFEIQAAGKTVLRHAPDAPCLFIGRGEADVQMQRGNFAISDYVSERIALRSATPSKGEGGVRIGFAAASGGPELLAIEVVESGHIRFMPGAEPINRLWLRVPAEVG